MRIFNLIIIGVILSCTPVAAPHASNNTHIKDPSRPEYSNEYTARITYYSTDGKWGNKVACQRAKYAKEGVTVAAHPDFKFGTRVYIPELKGKIGDGNFIIQDRGGAVTSKKASRGKAYVFDIYVASHSKIRKYAHSQSEYMKVYVDET
jgi:3D (Asp-Asp-Asp) domain-containing protein